MSLYLLVEAADGYRAVYALPEWDSGFTDRKIYLVKSGDEAGRKGVAGEREAVPHCISSEKRPARWVRQVTAIGIRQANRSALVANPYLCLPPYTGEVLARIEVTYVPAAGGPCVRD
jgi:hypothetical protein